MLRFLCLAMLVALASAATPYTDCGGTSKVSSFDLGGCTTATCTFKKGQTYTVTLVIIPDRNSATPTVDISFKTLLYEKALTSIACTATNPSFCNLVKGVETKIQYTYTIPADTPTISGSITAKVKDGQVQLICITAKSVKIQ